MEIEDVEENPAVSAWKHLSILRAPALSLVPVTELPRVTITMPGATIASDAGVVRGHGTLTAPSSSVLTATVTGIVERVNRLVAVRPLRSRYVAEIGDVVVGRVVELAPKRWKLDINARGDAQLLLSAVNLPGGIQRRRTADDELNMRSFFSEGDLVSAEVQELRNDGSIALHTRSLRYGKLSSGQLVTVQSSLVKRAKKHFHTLPCGVHIILGNNGYIFLSILAPESAGLVNEGPDASALERVEPDARQRLLIARVRNVIVALDLEFIAISPDSIMAVYNASLEQALNVPDILRPDVSRFVCASARALRVAAE